MKASTSILCAILLSLTAGGAAAQECAQPRLGQGQMAGTVTETSVILQARLTRGDRLRNHDLPGCPGLASWELSTDDQFRESFRTPWIAAEAAYDFIVKTRVGDLDPATRYYYRLWYGRDTTSAWVGDRATFRTLGGREEAREARLVVVTGMNVDKFYRDPNRAYIGPDRDLGFPALETILRMRPDYFVGTGDNVYFDARNQPFGFATEAEGIRRCYHEQFIRPRFHELFKYVATYWEKDDHDYRFNDCDNTGDRLPLPDLGVAMFLEQLPVADPADPAPVTYGTYRISKDLQIWLVEGRDYRSPNDMEDGPDKTIWGATQRDWLKQTLRESDATFKILISPTPMVGPDDRYKTDNHADIEGFRHERDDFFRFLIDEGINRNFYLVCGDRHWQYHSIHPTGIEEFSTGALVDANSRAGLLPGDPESSDPEAEIIQPYLMLDRSGGFLLFRVEPADDEEPPRIHFEFFDERGAPLYATMKRAR